ncbi:hypothetical protein [Massilia pseudoviolaceinigra]|uniref:hypothetical protein n=1 Tax=Massilia pseudoviolaceinigra TaxID=3057165 RepID=UPI0027966336|nr:hypothetical protein [Massilia sp. CCM 9206]MDQ1920142.1 hypothetical protein [Massilia sp. CCM 9206]
MSQVSPTVTPALRRGEHGLHLAISFTPAKGEESDAITDAVEAGTRKLIIYPGKQTAEAVRHPCQCQQWIEHAADQDQHGIGNDIPGSHGDAFQRTPNRFKHRMPQLTAAAQTNASILILKSRKKGFGVFLQML